MGQASLEGTSPLTVNPTAPANARREKETNADHCRERAMPAEGIEMGKSQETDQWSELWNKMNKGY